MRFCETAEAILAASAVVVATRSARRMLNVNSNVCFAVRREERFQNHDREEGKKKTAIRRGRRKRRRRIHGYETAFPSREGAV